MATSSSPSLPSPSEFHRPRQNLQSGSRAAAIPSEAFGVFKSVGGLLKVGGLDLGRVPTPEIGASEQETATEVKKSRKKVAKQRVPGNAEGDDTQGARKRRTATNKTTKKPKRPAAPKKSGYFEKEIPDSEAESHSNSEKSNSLEDKLSHFAHADTGEVINVEQTVKPVIKRSSKKRKSDEISGASCVDLPSNCQNEVVDNNPPSAPLSKLSKGPAKRSTKKRKSDEGSETVPKPTRTRKSKAAKSIRDPEAIKTSENAGDQPRKPKKTSNTSSHFAEKEVTPAVEALLVDTNTDQGAVVRRKDWTPVRDTTTFIEIANDDTVAGATPMLATQPVNMEVFKSFADFTCAGAGPLPAVAAPMKPLKKGRRIDAVAVKQPPAPKVKKPQSPKKKATTITDKATEQYRTAVSTTHNEALLEGAANIKDMLAPRQSTIQVSCEAKPKPARRKRTPSPSKSKKDAEKDKPLYLVPKLLSPESALRELGQQDFLFGTSSQLAQPESPTFIRALQASFSDTHVPPSDTMIAPQHSSKLAAITGSRTLWAAAARGEEQALFKCTPKKVATAAMPPDENEGFVDIDHLPSESPVLDVEETAHGERQLPPPTGHADDNSEPIPASVIVVDKSSPPASGLPSPELEPLDIAQSTLAAQHPIVMVIRSSSPVLPALSSPVAAQQSSPVSDHLPELSSILPSARSQPLPSRSATGLGNGLTQALSPRSTNTLLSSVAGHVITMNTKAQFSQSTAVAAGAPKMVATSPIRRPRGRPGKDANAPPATKTSPIRSKAQPAVTSEAQATKTTKSSQGSDWMHIDEIEDSEPDFCTPSPSPPRKSQTSQLELTSPSRGRAKSKSPSRKRQKPQSKSPPRVRSRSPTRSRSKSPTKSPTKARRQKSKTASKSVDKASAVVPASISAKQWAVAKVSLFPEIKHTITSVAPTTDLKNLTWHEKILMYDPIVPSELSEWLVSQGVKVSIADVDDESRNGDGNVEFGLEPWMVYEWCEEMSICCIWDEGLRKGLKNGRGK